jgi:hypothetical protein
LSQIRLRVLGLFPLKVLALVAMCSRAISILSPASFLRRSWKTYPGLRETSPRHSERLVVTSRIPLRPGFRNFIPRIRVEPGQSSTSGRGRLGAKRRAAELRYRSCLRSGSARKQRGATLCATKCRARDPKRRSYTSMCSSPIATRTYRAPTSRAPRQRVCAAPPYWHRIVLGSSCEVSEVVPIPCSMRRAVGLVELDCWRLSQGGKEKTTGTTDRQRITTMRLCALRMQKLKGYFKNGRLGASRVCVLSQMSHCH